MIDFRLISLKSNDFENLAKFDPVRKVYDLFFFFPLYLDHVDNKHGIDKHAKKTCYDKN